MTFPKEGWTLNNDVPLPDDPADPRGTATPENGPMIHGVYLSTKDYIVEDDGSIDPGAKLLGCFKHLETGIAFPPQVPEYFSPAEWGYSSAVDCLDPHSLPSKVSQTPGFEIEIPGGTTPSVELSPGVSYYLILWADSDRQVSEQNDVHNTVAVPIVITAANSPPGNIGFGTVVNAREGEPVTLTVTFDDPGDTGEGYTYIWVFGDGKTCDSSFTPELCGKTTVHIYEEDGVYPLSVTIIDSGGLDGTGSVDVEIFNVAPTVDAGPDVTVNEDTPFTSIGSFVDPGADPWTATVDYGDSSGVQPLDLNADKTFSLSHSYASEGVYAVTVTVSDDDGSTSDAATVTVANLAPVANSQSVTTDEDTAVGITLTGSDAGGDTLTFAVLFGPSSGSLSGTAPSLTYTPGGNFNGTDSFTYQANDGGSENNLSNVATVTIAVDPVNDSPVLNADSATTNEDIQMTIPVLLNDNDDADRGSLDPGSVTITGPPTNGSTTVDSSGVITYTPHENYNGVDSLQYRACDLGEPTPVLCGAATVTITVNPVNDSPVAKAGSNQTALEGAVASFTGGVMDPDLSDTHTYSWDFGDGDTATGQTATHVYADDGVFTVTLTVTDETGTPGSDSLSVTVQNVAPTVDAGGGGTVGEGDTFTGSGSFTDPGADTWTATVNYGDGTGQQPLALDEVNKTFSLSHPYAYSSEDAFTVTVTVTDDDGGSTGATSLVNVTNVAPVANSQTVTTNEDTAVAVTLTGTDAGGDGLTYAVVSGPSSGTLTGDAPALTYTPNGDFNGNDSFTFVANDGQSLSDPATVSITIDPINDAPVTQDDSVSVEENASITFDPVYNSLSVAGVLEDMDLESNPLTLTEEVGSPSNGAAVAVGNLVTYTPNQNYIGVDSFTYNIIDGQGGSAVGTVTVTVLDSVPDWGFIGLLSPWKEQPLYSFKVGSSFPISWQYSDPATGQVVDSEEAMIELRIKGPFTCNAGETDTTVEVIKFPGNSDYRYSTGTHKLNWDTNDVGLGCYNTRIYSGLTGQLDGPFKVKIRK